MLNGKLLAVIPGSDPESSYKEIPNSVATENDSEVVWHPENLVPGIYIYVYESPREKGVGKFTVVR